jgi:hypothetical protein
LSWALGTSATQQKSDRQMRIETTNNGEISEIQLQQSADFLNQILHDEIRRLSATTMSMDPVDVAVSSLLNETDTRLTSFIHTITQAVRAKHTSAMSDITRHTKKIRQYFIICLLMNCINSTQSKPIHKLLADVVESNGGSRQLMKLLNRLGCVSSPDSHDRFVTFHAEHQLEQNIWSKINPDIFTIASVDNFDILQSHSAMYHGTIQRSFHGTIVQLVQPNCSMIIKPPQSFSTIAYKPRKIS